jgi:hypothetical protein
MLTAILACQRTPWHAISLRRFDGVSRRFHSFTGEETALERADWLEEGVDSADARFLMATAITHHRFSAPIWGAREVRKLQAELAEIAGRAAEIMHEHRKADKKKKKSRPAPRYRGVFGAPAW